MERFETVIVGGGQAGLATGYELKKRGRPFVILEANERVGDSWRKRWDSLRLFTPAKYDGLPGMRFPAPRWSFPTKDEMGDYLERPTRCGSSCRSRPASPSTASTTTASATSPSPATVSSPRTT